MVEYINFTQEIQTKTLRFVTYVFKPDSTKFWRCFVQLFVGDLQWSFRDFLSLPSGVGRSSLSVLLSRALARLMHHQKAIRLIWLSRPSPNLRTFVKRELIIMSFLSVDGTSVTLVPVRSKRADSLAGSTKFHADNFDKNNESSSFSHLPSWHSYWNSYVVLVCHRWSAAFLTRKWK